MSLYVKVNISSSENGLFDSISVNYRRFPLSIIGKDLTFEFMQLDRLIYLDLLSHGSDASDHHGV